MTEEESLEHIWKWLKETIEKCEYEAYGKEEPDDIILDKCILPYLRGEREKYADLVLGNVIIVHKDN